MPLLQLTQNILHLEHSHPIENHFLIALDDEETRNGALIGLATLKYDFYLASGFVEKSPKYHELKNELINKSNISVKDVEISKYMSASYDLQKDLFEYLG